MSPPFFIYEWAGDSRGATMQDTLPPPVKDPDQAAKMIEDLLEHEEEVFICVRQPNYCRL
jgi:hypothetical protein